MPEITLRHGDLELTLTPEQGGSLSGFRHRGLDLFHPTAPGAARNHTCFPMVPFSGRIDHGRFTFAGREHRLAPNFAPEPHAIHGQGWTSPWRVTAQHATAATLVLEHAEPDTGFRYRAEQRFTLRERALDVALAVTHTGDAPMPYGLGLHPYLARRPGTLLSAEVAAVWRPDATNIPRTAEPVPVEDDFRLRRPVEELTLDHNLAGWNGTARIDWPLESTALLIEADPVFGHLVVYVPRGRPYFCVEPASHVADGVNLMARGVEGTGVRVLEPGQTLAGSVRFRVLAGAATG